MNDRSGEDASAWIQRENLPFRVLQDPDRSIGTDYGISEASAEKYVANNAEGRRPVVVIDEEGRVLRVLPDVRTVEDQAAALSDL